MLQETEWPLNVPHIRVLSIAWDVTRREGLTCSFANANTTTRHDTTRHDLFLPVTSASTPQPVHHRWEIPTVFVGKREGKRPLGRRKKNVRIILKCISKKRDRRTCSGLMWPRIETSGGLLWKQQWTFGFHKMRGISWLAVELLAS